MTRMLIRKNLREEELIFRDSSIERCRGRVKQFTAWSARK